MNPLGWLIMLLAIAGMFLIEFGYWRTVKAFLLCSFGLHERSCEFDIVTIYEVRRFHEIPVAIIRLDRCPTCGEWYRKHQE